MKFKLLIVFLIFCIVIVSVSAETARIKLLNSSGVQVGISPVYTVPIQPDYLIEWNPYSAAKWCYGEGQYKLVYVQDGVDVVEANAYYLNFDQNQSACECFTSLLDLWEDTGDSLKSNFLQSGTGVSPWQAGPKCCGDDISKDGGFLAVQGSSNFTCINDSSNQWYWMGAGQTPGDIFYVAQGNYHILSDGFKWYACDARNDGTGNFNQALGVRKSATQDVVSALHSYKCILKDGVEQFAECRGNAASGNINDGKFGTRSLTTGGTIFSGTTPYFCTDQYIWITDLDSQSTKGTCEAAGFKWTGSLCCGDDFRDTYNDIDWAFSTPIERGNFIGGCFSSVAVKNNTLVSDDINSIVKNGGFSQRLMHWEYSDINEVQALTDGKLKLFPGQTISQEITPYVIPGKEYKLLADISSFTGSEGAVSVLVDGVQLTESVIFSSGEQLNRAIVRFYIPDTANKIILKISVAGSRESLFDNIAMNLYVKNILNYNGSFYACRMEEFEQDSYNDIQNGGALISDSKNLASCDIQGSYFCGPDGNFELKTAGIPSGSNLVRDTPKYLPIGYSKEGLAESSCCPSNYCWNGTNCVSSEINTALDELNAPIWISSTEAYICSAGNWNKTALRTNWDNTQQGICSSDIQCLVDNNGDSDNNNMPELYEGPDSLNNPQCINDGQYIGDHYCNKGNWTSRTKYIALQMLTYAQQYSSSDFSIYCDHYTKSLVDYAYSEINVGAAADLLSGTSAVGFSTDKVCDSTSAFECINNECVLRLFKTGGDLVMFGTSLNKPVNDNTKSYLKLLKLDKSVCDSLIGQGKGFKPCDSTNKVWYSDILNSVIYSNQAVVFETTGENRAVLNVLDNLVLPDSVPDISKLKNIVKWASLNQLSGIKSLGIDPLSFSYSYINLTKDYNTIYLDKHGNKLTYSLRERPFGITDDREFIAGDYINFGNLNVCSALTSFAYAHSPVSDPGDVNCTVISSEDYRIIGTSNALLNSWPDLGSRLRIKR